MIIAKGFYSVPSLVNNTENTTAVFGELSQKATTYSRDYKTYTRPASQVSFCLFSCKDGSLKSDLTQVYSDLVCEVGEWAIAIGPNITNTNTKNDFIQLMQIQFDDRTRNITVGDLVTDTIRRLPKWISWETIGQSGTLKFKVWLSTEDFESSYDEFEIAVVPPVDGVDKLFQPYSELLVELSKNTLAVIHERMNEASGRFPATMIQTQMTELIDRTNTTNTIQIGWTVLIYGPAGNTTDNIKDAIKAYIAANSLNTESDWRLLIPDLFNTTCFFIIPRWDKFAIESRLSIPGIHSPVVNSNENFNYVKTLTAAYIPNQHLIDNLETTIHRYKSISINIVGSNVNRLSLFKFTDYFPDYLAVESNIEDFNRQTQATKDITNLFTLILKKIDLYSQDSTIPVNLRLIEKYNQRFIVGKVNNIEYYILMKPEQQPI